MIFVFLKNLGRRGVCMQKYPKSTSTQKVSGTGTAPFLEYPCFIFKRQFLHIDEGIFKRRWALQRIIATMILGFVIGVAYFGMLFGVENLGFNIYLSVIFNASLLIPTNMLTLFFIERWNRKVSLFAFCTTSGICSIIRVVVCNGKEGIQIGLELASFFCSSLAYNVLMIFTIELFPTSVRNLTTSLARQAIVVGSVFDPIMNLAGRKNEFLSFGIFGLTILL